MHVVFQMRTQSGSMNVARDGMTIHVSFGPWRFRLTPSDALALAEALEQAVVDVPVPTGHRK